MYSVVVQGNTKMRDIPTPETLVLMLWEKVDWRMVREAAQRTVHMFL